MSEERVCPRCGKDFEPGREEYMDPKMHGWPVFTGEQNDDGIDLWKLLLCVDATDEQIEAYKEARQEANVQRGGIVARGLPKGETVDGGE